MELLNSIVKKAIEELKLNPIDEMYKPRMLENVYAQRIPCDEVSGWAVIMNEYDGLQDLCFDGTRCVYAKIGRKPNTHLDESVYCYQIWEE